MLTGFGVTDAQLDWLTGDAAVPRPRRAADGAAPVRCRRRRALPALATAGRPVRAAQETAALERRSLRRVPGRRRCPRRSIGSCSPPAGIASTVDAFLGPDGLADRFAARGPPPAGGRRATSRRSCAWHGPSRSSGASASRPPTLYAWANTHSRCRRRRGDRPGGEGALRRDALARSRAAAQRSAARRAPRRARRLPAAAHARSRHQEPQSALRVLPHRRRHEPVHADVADPSGHRRRADLLPALPDEPRAAGPAAHHRRQRLEVAEELPGLGGQPQDLPLPGELDRAGAARRQVAAVPGSRARPSSSRRSRTTTSRRHLPTTSKGSTRSRVSMCAASGSRSGRRTGWSRGPSRAALHIPAAAVVGMGRWHVPRLRADVQCAATSGTTGGSRTAAHWTPWEKIDADIEGEHLRARRLPAPHAPVLDAVPRGQQAGRRAGPRKQGPAAHRRQGLGDPAGLFGVRPGPLVAEADVHGRRASTIRTFMPQIGASHDAAQRQPGPVAVGLHAARDGNDAGDLPQLHVHLYCRAVESRPGRAPARRSAPADVERIARFELNGCNGALVPGSRQVRSGARWCRPPPRAARQAPARSTPRSATSRQRGGRRIRSASPMAASSTRRRAISVDGMGFAVSPGRRGALLALPGGDARGVAVALAAPRTRGVRPHRPRDAIRACPSFAACIRSSSRIASAATSSGRSTPTGGRRRLVAVRRARQPRRAADARSRPAGGRARPPRPSRVAGVDGARTSIEDVHVAADRRGAGRLGGSSRTRRGIPTMPPRRGRRDSAGTRPVRSRKPAAGAPRPAAGRGPGPGAPLQRRRAPPVRAAPTRAAITSGACSSRRSSIPTRAGS